VRFDALCQEYREVVELLDTLKVEVERLSVLEAQARRLGERKTWLEEELLTRIEGHEPH